MDRVPSLQKSASSGTAVISVGPPTTGPPFARPELFRALVVTMVAN